ncbi:hypothetical protein BC629DRAFT_1595854 [Irpex lacteus]|nr:hypothetical protein BC629DRAFT_1595854 [Irpex lacteus]
MNVLQVFGVNIVILVALDIIGSFFNVIPPIIVCRFILNLRQVKHAGSSWVSGGQSHSLRFVGNMGQSLQFGEDEQEEIELEGEEPAAVLETVPELATEASNSDEANEGEVDCGIQEVPRHYDV